MAKDQLQNNGFEVVYPFDSKVDPDFLNLLAQTNGLPITSFRFNNKYKREGFVEVVVLEGDKIVRRFDADMNLSVGQNVIEGNGYGGYT